MSLAIPSRKELQRKIILTLQQKAVAEGVENFTKAELAEDGRFPPYDVFLELFQAKCLDDIFRLAGLRPKHPTKQELIRVLRQFYLENGRPPRRSDAEMGLLGYSASVFQKRFGSWNNALLAANLSIISAHGGHRMSTKAFDAVSNCELIRYVQAIAGDTGIIITSPDYSAGNYKYPLSLYTKRFRYWSLVTHLARLQSIKTISSRAQRAEIRSQWLNADEVEEKLAA